MNLGLFWGVGLCLLPFYIKFANVIDIRSSQNYLFCFLCFFSFLLFGIKKSELKERLVFSFFIIGSFFLSSTPYFNYTFWHWLSTSCGILLFIQLRNGLTWVDKKYLERGFLACLAIQIAWVIANYFGDTKPRLNGNKEVNRESLGFVWKYRLQHL